MIEPIIVVISALTLDLIFGDPKSRYHPTAWIGYLISKLVLLSKNESIRLEKIGGIGIVLISVVIVALPLSFLNYVLNMETLDYFSLILLVILGAILLKTTIAIKGMKQHAMRVVEALEYNDIDSARDRLSMLVKRNTKNLDKNHIYSGVIESISENTVDGITGPLFYFTFFGLPGAFVYRTVNTIDSMIGYKNDTFKNIGWFGANCDKILNYLPSRITGIIMILSAMILGNNWKKSFQIMLRDAKKTESPNAGYPMSAIAGALGTKFEKIDHYSLGDGDVEFSKDSVKSALLLMKTTSILFAGIFVIPIILILTILGWWIHA